MAITAAKLMVEVGANTAEAESKLKGVSGTLTGFGSKAAAAGKAMTLGLTLPLLAVGTAAVKMAADFDTNMSMLAAVSGATGDELTALGDAARALGADMTLPGTSAADAAEAMLELSKAGLDVNEVLGASKGVLQLAAAGNLSNAAAAEIAANALNAFGLEGSEAVRVADLLAAAANASSGEVNDMADSLKMVATVAAAAGMPIEDVVTAISELANAGIKGSDAGTSLKQMIMSLQAPSAKAAKLMGDLGIAIYDAQGAMLPMEQLIANFTGALGGLTQEQRNAALATIFGSDAVRAANVVLLGGVDAFNSMGEAVGEAGAAAKLAAAQMTGINGAIEGLKNTVQDAMIAGVQPFKDDIIALAGALADAVRWFSGLTEAQQETIVKFAALLAAAGPVLVIVGQVATGIGALTGALSAASAAVTAFGVATGLTLATVAPLIVAVGALSAAGYVLYKRNQDLNEAARQAAAGLDVQLKAIAGAAGSYEDYAAKTQAALLHNHLLTQEVNGQVRVFNGQSGVLVDVTDKFGLMSEAEWVAAQATAAAAGELLGLAGAGNDVGTAMAGAAGEIDGVSVAIAEAQSSALDASTILGTLEGALSDAGWSAGDAAAAQNALASALGVTGDAAGQAASDVQLLADAFAANIIGQDDFTAFMQSAQAGTLALSESQRSSLQASLDYARSLEDTAAAAQNAAKAQLDLAQSLKGASEAQVAQAAIGALGTALDSGQVSWDQYIAAVSGVQQAFGLTDQQSVDLAAGITAITAALGEGTVPAEGFATALQNVMTAAGTDTFGPLMDSFGKAPAAIEPATEAVDGFAERMVTMSEDAGTAVDGVITVWSTAPWTATGRTTADALAAPIKAYPWAADAATATAAIKGGFANADWNGVGMAIANRIAAGITSGTSKITQAAKAAAKAAYDAALAALCGLPVGSGGSGGSGGGSGGSGGGSGGSGGGSGGSGGGGSNNMLAAPLAPSPLAPVPLGMGLDRDYLRGNSTTVNVTATVDSNLDMYALALRVADEIRRRRL